MMMVRSGNWKRNVKCMLEKLLDDQFQLLFFFGSCVGTFFAYKLAGLSLRNYDASVHITKHPIHSLNWLKESELLHCLMKKFQAKSHYRSVVPVTGAPQGWSLRQRLGVRQTVCSSTFLSLGFWDGGYLVSGETRGVIFYSLGI